MQSFRKINIRNCFYLEQLKFVEINGRQNATFMAAPELITYGFYSLALSIQIIVF